MCVYILCYVCMYVRTVLITCVHLEARVDDVKKNNQRQDSCHVGVWRNRILSMCVFVRVCKHINVHTYAHEIELHTCWIMATLLSTKLCTLQGHVIQAPSSKHQASSTKHQASSCQKTSLSLFVTNKKCGFCQWCGVCASHVVTWFYFATVFLWYIFGRCHQITQTIPVCMLLLLHTA
jgi:hypothetical protein